MSYIEKVLGNGETIVCRAHVSLWNFIGLIVLSVLLLLAGMASFAATHHAVNLLACWAVALLPLLTVLIRFHSTELAVTNKRVIVKVGFISRDTMELNLSKIESIRVQQNIMGRIFNYGTIIVVGTGASHEPLLGISDPIGFRRKFDDVTLHAANPPAPGGRSAPNLRTM